ncbi:MAG TPA: tRNA (adenosine(37)-N6)-threonylcarbamoyltransferase complex ATPase subunit type 1 TsaE, partial [Pirellulales bacterium]|nr:tRNA (adenosine(37)-N6)-threonylcarbamoyltransferase complex ATPase subunit type 1 TsaE [Pirellulales bacterium]
RLVQAVAAALGVDPRDVVSPTFVLVQEYHGRTAVFHFDAYRLKNEAEFWELGPQEYFSRRGLSLVEWADRVSGCLPAERLQIAIEITGETSRRFLISATGSDYDQIVDRLAAWADKRGMSTQRAAPQHPGVTLAEQATMRNNHEPLRDRS